MRLSIRNKFATALGLLAIAVVAAGFCSVLASRFNEDALSELQQGRLRSLLLARDAQNSFHRYVKDVEVAVSTNEPQVLVDDDALIAELERNIDEFNAINEREHQSEDFASQINQLAHLSKEYVRLAHQQNADTSTYLKVGHDAADLRLHLGTALQELERNASLAYERDVAGIILFNQQATKVYMLFVSAMTIAAIGLAGAILATVLQRIRKLGEHFASTDLEKITPLNDGGHKDELADLVKASNRMLLGIKESRRQLVDKALLDSVMDALVDLIVVVDGKGRIVRANRASERLLGSSPSALEGCLLSDWLLPDERTKTADVDLLLAAVGRRETVSEELSLQNANGALVPVHLLGAQLPGGETTQAVFVARDLRAKLSAEKKMQGIQAQLVQASKLASLGTLGAGVAHELNNPLAAIRGYAELITNAVDVPPSPRALAAKILKASDRIRKITDHLRIFAADTSRNEKRAIDLNGIINDSLILLQNQLVTSGMSVDVELTPNLPFVLGDANQLESVVQNLITNARDALSETTDNRSRKIKIASYMDPQGRITCAITDNANGIPELVQPRVFDPFFTTKEIGKGTGLGLSISHGIVRDHGGSLTFLTEKGKGTTFLAAFPKGQRTTGAGSVMPISTAADVKGTAPALPQIAVIHGVGVFDADTTKQLGADFTLRAFDNFDDGVSGCREQAFDLVIVDIAATRLSGVETVRRLRGVRGDMKILVLAGSKDSDEDVRAALNAGAVGAISKPLPPVDELREQLTTGMKPAAKLRAG